MGHIRLGRLPKTKPWQRVFGILDGSDVDPAQLSNAVLGAARKELAGLKGDEAVSYCFWVLARVATAARSPDFASELRRLGIPSEGVQSGAQFVQRVAKAVQAELQRRGMYSAFARIAELSLRQTLSGAITEQSRSLFGTGLPEIQTACRDISAKSRFGRVGQDYFANFLNRALSYLVDKELSNFVGAGRALGSSRRAIEFHEALAAYCTESARIVEEYAGGWLSKHNWESNNDISERETGGFCAYALEKLLMDLPKAEQ